MKIITSIKEMQETMKRLKVNGKNIGYVPTMGFLHDGHLKLIQHARNENEIVAISIFVNPKQFGPNEDFESYPRDFMRDERLAEEAGVDYIFYPDVNEMYPRPMSVSLKVEERVNVLCGASRPGHFDGVLTVLVKLFNIIQCDKAYFGMKDAQQVAIVQSLVDDFNLPLELVPVDTVREEDGLAKSSRNVNLNDQERIEAPYIYKTILAAKEKIELGEKDVAVIESFIKSEIQNKTSGEIDYVSLLTFPNLTNIEYITETIIIAIAVQFSKARLIDNIIVRSS